MITIKFIDNTELVLSSNLYEEPQIFEAGTIVLYESKDKSIVPSYVFSISNIKYISVDNN